ncbi:hypothetical protein KC906_03425, partial [Candidatus Kaiserbacteria bacterium]|nr:hypothetical protein [Candidatus Kaiserbacteria bacterium]
MHEGAVSRNIHFTSVGGRQRARVKQYYADSQYWLLKLENGKNAFLRQHVVDTSAVRFIMPGLDITCLLRYINGALWARDVELAPVLPRQTPAQHLDDRAPDRHAQLTTRRIDAILKWYDPRGYGRVELCNNGREVLLSARVLEAAGFPAHVAIDTELPVQVVVRDSQLWPNAYEVA